MNDEKVWSTAFLCYINPETGLNMAIKLQIILFENSFKIKE